MPGVMVRTCWNAITSILPLEMFSSNTRASLLESGQKPGARASMRRVIQRTDFPHQRYRAKERELEPDVNTGRFGFPAPSLILGAEAAMQENRMRSSRHPTSNSGTQRTPARSGTAASAPNLKLGAEEYISAAPIRPCRHPDPVWGPTRTHRLPKMSAWAPGFRLGAEARTPAFPRCPFGHPVLSRVPKRTFATT